MKNLLFLVFSTIACILVHAQCGSPSYVDPQFTISVQNPACPLSGEIRVVSSSDGIPPYTFTLLPNNISNSTGLFQNITAGTYLVQMKDACGTIRTRQATVAPYNFTAASSMVALGCRHFEFSSTCSATGPRLEYGYALNGNTGITWGDSSVIHLTLNAPTSVDLYVRDSCGNEAVSHQYINKEQNGYIKELQMRIKCNGQEIYPVFFGFDAPSVCLYLSPQNTLVECKQAPPGNYSGGAATNFLNLPFGQDYYVIVQDGCYRDSAFFKDKTSMGGSELNPFNWKCTTFDLHSDGNNSDSVCLYNATTNQLVSCKPKDTTSINPHTGLPWPYGGAEWYDLQYGSYYSYIFDPCADTLVRIDTTVVYPRSFSTQMYYVCSVVQSAIGSYFAPDTPNPHTTTVYYPDNSIAVSATDAGNFLYYPTWPSPGTITVIQEDGCGYRDTSQLIQPDLLPTRSISFRGGCPGINGNSGGADLVLSGNALAYGGRGNGAPVATVTIIKKDGLPVTIPQSNTQWNALTNHQEYFFNNLTTGVYILESTIGCAGYKVYDTTEVKPYIYPEQDQTHIMQCGSNPFAFKDTITGGVAPYTYEIISTTALMPSLLTGTQTSNVFTIPPGTNLSTISIQVIDACGNSDTKVYPVNHSVSCTTLAIDTAVGRLVLQNKSITIYPNPSGNRFTIAFAQKKKTDYQIEIYNAAGIKVYSKSVKDIDTKNVSITENLQPGSYVIEVFDLKGNKPFYQKHIVL